MPRQTAAIVWPVLPDNIRPSLSGRRKQDKDENKIKSKTKIMTKTEIKPKTEIKLKTKINMKTKVKTKFGKKQRPSE